MRKMFSCMAISADGYHADPDGRWRGTDPAPSVPWIRP